MKCNDARTFMSQIAGKSVTIQVQQSDVNFLSTNGYLSVMQKEDYDQAAGEVANLTQMNDALQNEMVEERIGRAALAKDERKTHSILFHLEGRDEKEAEVARVESERGAVAREDADMEEEDSRIKEQTQKKTTTETKI